MRFKLVTGPAFAVTCLGCQSHHMAGSEPYQSASTGLLDGRPDRIYALYADEEDRMFEAYYCEQCAANRVGYEDTTRSVTKFFADTAGDKIL